MFSVAEDMGWVQHIPNRTENVVKNHWNATARRVSRLMKRLRATPGALNSINFNSLEHYIMVTVCGGDPNTGVGHGPNTLPGPPVSMPAFSQDLSRRMQVGLCSSAPAGPSKLMT